jgi:DNA (cytosine-5)-methyltransferase 1
MHDEPIEYFLEREERSSTGQIGKSLGVAVRMEMLPTVTTQDGKNSGGPSQFERNTLPLNTQVLDITSWGRFEPAIRRWETVLQRPAPAPTNPDGKDGNHRLSSKFTEWMMGLPDGWITDAGLTRNEELKACGNGVVPQQAELALRMLLK